MDRTSPSLRNLNKFVFCYLKMLSAKRIHALTRYYVLTLLWRLILKIYIIYIMLFENTFWVLLFFQNKSVNIAFTLKMVWTIIVCCLVIHFELVWNNPFRHWHRFSILCLLLNSSSSGISLQHWSTLIKLCFQDFICFVWPVVRVAQL